ncbi:hypothetical protein PAXRUDRAFT_137987, partial [Paxillus rubicundulus Ve08.2h10]
IKQWTGTFFEDLSLSLASMVLHLGHCRQPCPAAVPQCVDPQVNGVPCPVDKMECTTEEPDDVPPFLQVSQGGNYLTLVNMTSMHFLWVR